MTQTAPRRKPVQIPARPLRSSATRIQLGDKKLARAQGGKREDWQEESYEYYDDVGMVKYVIRFRGNQMAKLRIFPAVRPPDDPEGKPIPVLDPESGISPETAQRAIAEIDRIKGASGGTPEILRMLDMNIELVGECYVVGYGPKIVTRKDPTTQDEYDVLILESWDVRSILEVKIENDGVYRVLDPLTGKFEKLDPDNDVIVRIWQRHPGIANRADCNMRAVLGDCESLVLLTNEVKAESKAKQNNGLLFIPNTMSVSVPATQPTPAEDSEDPNAIDAYPDETDEPAAASIAEALEESMMEGISDPGSPWTVAPRVLIGPPEDGKEIRYIDLSRKSSDRLEDRIAARKEAIAQGMNMPIEVAKGHDSTTFANAAQIDADIFEKHLESECILVCDMWTTGLLQPALIEAGVAEEIATQIIVWYDPVNLIEPVDPAEHVKEALELELIGHEAARRYWNFSEDDAPEPLEQLINAILKQRSWDPGLVDAVIGMLVPTLELPDPTMIPDPVQAAQTATLIANLEALRGEGHSGTRTDVLTGLYGVRDGLRALRASAEKTSRRPENPGYRFAGIDRDLFTKSLAVLNAAMTRALERAGNRLKAKAGPLRAEVRLVAPMYAAQRLGREVIRASPEVTEDELLDADAFDAAVGQYHTWARHAQEKALAAAAAFAGFSATKRQQLAAAQAKHLQESTVWLRDNMAALADERLFAPDPREPAHGEFDPSLRVPPGLVRTAIAIAGGVTALEAARSTDPYVVTRDGGPVGGIGTGDLIHAALMEEPAIVQVGVEWDYGEAFRSHPYEPHEALMDLGTVESPLDFGEDDFTDPAEPGNHSGCACNPIIHIYDQVATAEPDVGD